MSDAEEDPYAVSSDSEDEDAKRKPPPKINIEGRSEADFKQIKQSLATTGKTSPARDDRTREEIEALRRANAEAMAQKKRDFEAGKSSLKNDEDSTDSQFTSEQREEIGSLKRSEAERKKLLAAFMEEEAKEPTRNCHICGQIVYPVERVIAAKNTYHNVCFKCTKCSKKLTPTTFNSHEGLLYCRAHYNEAIHPEQVGSLVDADAENEVEHDEDEFALVSKPKQLASDVVRASDQTCIGDELAQIRSLKEKKAELEKQAAAQQNASAEQRRLNAAEEIAAGRVRENRERIAAGGGATDDADADAESEADARARELDAVRAQAHATRDRWLAGAAAFDASELDARAVAEARRSFVEGSAFQQQQQQHEGGAERAADLEEIGKRGALSSFRERFERGALTNEESSAVGGDKSIIDLGVQLKSIKESLATLKDENSMTPEERAEKKKKEIEEEFLRYKLARKIREKRHQQNPADAAAQEGEDESADRPASGLDVEIKMAGRAREKFREIEAQGAQAAPLPGRSAQEPRASKWDTAKREGSAEVVNRRAVEESDDEEDEEFDVKHLMNKFKSIATEGSGSKMERRLDELEALRVEAKNLRERFESARRGEEEEEASEERKRQLEEEFRRLKEERERARQELEAEQQQAQADQGTLDKEEIQVAAAHASKMAAKFEKITRKEAKKAEKMRMPQRADH